MVFYNYPGGAEVCDLINFRVQRRLLHSTTSTPNLYDLEPSRMSPEGGLAFSIYQDAAARYTVM